jgi:minor extracellular serine protease Vpr
VLRRRYFSAVIVFAFLFASVGPVSSAKADGIDNGLINAADDETASSWFVELTTAPTSEGNSVATTEASKDSFRNAAKSKGIDLKERYSYNDLFNGVSVSASSAQINAIQRLPGVKTVWPVVTESLPTPAIDGGETIDLSSAIQMTGADYVQNTLGFTGKGIKVAIMDTGIDYNNPDLGGCFGPGCRVFTGWDFVGDAYNADSSSLLYSPTPVPDANPDDCNGHGTHVSGIVGANGVVKGVAPDVRFGAYRVFGCNGSTQADIMLAAMERALKDHMDILNMSIGSAFTWPQYPTAVAADRLVRKHGMVVVASIGNSGANGLYSAGAPGVGEKVIGVASFDNAKVTLPYFTISPDGAKAGYIQASGVPAAPTSGSAPLARTGTKTSAADACSALPAGSLTGKVALIRRGTCGFYIKGANAQAAGAVGVVLYNNFPTNPRGYINASAAGIPALTIPVVGTNETLGEMLDDRLAAGPVTLTWTADISTFPSATGGLISSFSSYGLAPDLSLKPDIGAPGGNIYSTLPLEQGGHGTLSGTSMASPHVAGAVALLMQATPQNVKELGLDGVRGLLQNTADPHPIGSLTSTVIDAVQRQGAGMLNIRAAIEAGAAVTPGKLSLGESQAGPVTRKLTITDLKGPKNHDYQNQEGDHQDRDENDDNKAVTYTFSNQPAVATGPSTFAPAFFVAPATVSFSVPSVSLKKNKSASVNVTITAPAALADGSLYGGYVVVTGSDGSTYRVPYSGFKGDYQAIQVLTPVVGLGNVPGLSVRQLGFVNSAASPGAIVAQYATLPAGFVFSMVNKPNVSSATCPPCGYGSAIYPTFADIPSYLLHLNHQSRSATFKVYDSTGTVLQGEAFTEEYLPRNSTTTGFFAFSWDGFVGPAGSQTALPAGTYVMKVTVVKALGGPTDTETFTFGAVTIAAPPAP